jgi:hypothetical protein
MCFSFQLLIKHRRFCDQFISWATRNPQAWRVMAASVVFHDTPQSRIGGRFDSQLPHLLQAALRLADLLALALCCECITSAIFRRLEAVDALLFWGWGLADDFLYLHTDIYAK